MGAGGDRDHTLATLRTIRVTLPAMSAFTPGEIAYLQSQRLGRIAPRPTAAQIAAQASDPGYFVTRRGASTGSGPWSDRLRRNLLRRIGYFGVNFITVLPLSSQ